MVVEITFVMAVRPHLVLLQEVQRLRRHQRLQQVLVPGLGRDQSLNVLVLCYDDS